MSERLLKGREMRNQNIAKIVGLLILIFTPLNLGLTMMSTIPYGTPRFTPEIIREQGRSARLGTYIYNHQTIAEHPEYFEDIARLADIVLVDISWGRVMRNDSENPFDLAEFNFYSAFLENLSVHGLDIVIQFSPTRSPPGWLDVELEMRTYRAQRPPIDVKEYEHFVSQLLRYVEEVVTFFKDMPYLNAPLEWCLADEPNTEHWTPVMEDMYDLIKELNPEGLVSIVQDRPYLYQHYADACDLFTIDPYGSDKLVEDRIRLAYSATQEEKPVRVIISGMARPNDYYMIRRQIILSWFMGAHDVWYWSYNARWDGQTNDWYVVLFNETSPEWTDRAYAVFEAKQDLHRFGQIEEALLNSALSTELKNELSTLEQRAYDQIMALEFAKANATLNSAINLIN